MNYLFQSLIIIPLLGYVISIFLPEKKEKLISGFAIAASATHGIALLVFFILWLLNNHITLDVKDAVLLKTSTFEFFVDFCFDKVTAVFMMVGAFLAFIVTLYSRYYLHREKGYKRFYSTIMLFYLGYTIAVMAGNLETLFIGWEVLGVSSFLLIAFYRERYLPVRNAVKVFSIYRIGDVGLVLAIWMNHHLWHENITFLKLTNYEIVHEHLQTHSYIGVFISLMILLAALVKSAQFPFSAWLPRAMEGPTPSSAIFYGSLSVHLGIFILLRTYPFWEYQTSIRVLIILLGSLTAIVATSISRVQSNIKSKIAYASIAQIGIIFIEMAFGFLNIALIHFTANALLRTYQLLISPSVVSYLIKDQFYNAVPSRKTIEDSLTRRLEFTFYMWSLKEFNLDNFMSKYVWGPLEKIGKRLEFISVKSAVLFSVIIYIIGLYLLFHEELLAPQLIENLPIFFTLIGMMLVIKSFREKENVVSAWLLIILNHCWISLAISFNEHFKNDQTLVYLSGIVVSGILGLACIRYIRSKEKDVDLLNYHGHIFEHPILALVFFIACLGLSGFPITPTFVGEDLIFSHIHDNQITLAILTALCFMIDGLSVIRIYSKVFLGPHTKTYHEIAYKSS
jgi:NADH:ubiquinone oxidoreductase subunit 5 (subunit L)/multisubunit Na+/H+ antiporter MnhA subunit